MFNKSFIKLIMSLLLFVTSTNTAAELTIEASKVKFTDGLNQVEYNGNVHLIKDELELHTETLLLQHSPKGDMLSLHAEGYPTYFRISKDRVVQGESKIFDYDFSNEIVTLIDSVQIENKKATLKAHQVKYYVKTENMEAEGQNIHKVEMELKNFKPPLEDTSL